jgi:hypothetical protein
MITIYQAYSSILVVAMITLSQLSRSGCELLNDMYMCDPLTADLNPAERSHVAYATSGPDKINDVALIATSKCCQNMKVDVRCQITSTRQLQECC